MSLGAEIFYNTNMHQYYNHARKCYNDLNRMSESRTRILCSDDLQLFTCKIGNILIQRRYLLSMGLQPAKGSPEYPSSHEQMGWWFCTLQRALKPQDPAQGLTQVPARQANARGQSWLMTH